VQAPLDVTVLRSGIPDTLPGRSVNLCERGIAAVLSGEVTVGDPVGLELRLPSVAEPLRTRALVRYYDQLQCGMEFIGLSAAQQASIRDWMELSKVPAESEAGGSEEAPAGDGKSAASDRLPSKPGDSKAGAGARPYRKPRIGWKLLLIAVVVCATALWWRWNRGWEELESGLVSRPVNNGINRVHVPAEVMEKLLLHRVDPEYPPAARPAGLQGVIVLNVVVAADGSVIEARPLNGPEVLSRAAVEALRWWKFQPYRVNGQAVEVETTVAVEFKSPSMNSQ
jgi:TonB family protein